MGIERKYSSVSASGLPVRWYSCKSFYNMQRTNHYIVKKLQDSEWQLNSRKFLHFW